MPSYRNPEGADRIKCIHNDQPPCKRCKDRGEQCLFPPPGTSSIHRQSKLRHESRRGSNFSSRTEDSTINNIGREVSQLMRSVEDGSPLDLSARNPFDLFDDEVKNSYLRCSYKWSFHHIPSLLISVRKSTLDTAVMWAILALAIRFSNDAPRPFAAPIEASNAFAAHAKSLAMRGGAGDGRQAWIYLGMAVRMAQVIGLFEESAPCRSRENFIMAEERRRTAWTCFLMDSLLSGGKGRRRTLTVDDMSIQLPCDTECFHFGEAVRCETLDGNISGDISLGPIGNLGIVAYSMRAADTWGSVARWACSPAVDGQLPWEADSEFQRLLACLDRWRLSLPSRLEFGVLSLHAHSASNNGQAYSYMHSIYFMSIMFLHRSYLSQVETQNKHDSDSILDQKWRQWQARSRKELLHVTDEVCEMFEEMREFGLFFLRGLVPWIGFTVYTAVGIMLYYHHFADGEDDEGIVRRSRDRVINGCAFLKDMRGSWPMADSWRETIKRMQVFYTNIKTQGEHGVSGTERTEMRNAIVDYGALQHSPVHEQSLNKSSAEEFRPRTASNPGSSSVSPPVSILENTPEMQPQSFENFNLVDFDIFDTNFTITDAEMEAIISNSTQDFWANFPGEVGLY